MPIVLEHAVLTVQKVHQGEHKIVQYIKRSAAFVRSKSTAVLRKTNTTPQGSSEPDKWSVKADQLIKRLEDNPGAVTELEVRWSKLMDLKDIYTDGESSRVCLVFPATKPKD